MEGGRRRITLYDQMLAVSDGRELASGFTLNDVLTIQKRASPSPSPAVRLHGRTLLDIIRDDVGKSPVSNRERKSWKFLRDRLRLNLRSQIPPPNSLRFPGFTSADMMPNDEQSPEPTTTAAVSAAPSLRQISRRNSTRFNPSVPPSSEATNSDASPDNNSAAAASGAGGRSLLRPQMSRHNSTRFSVERSESFTDLTEPAREGTRRLSAALAEERSMSAREAVAAQEAADAEAIADVEEQEEEQEAESTPAPMRMSLMDLLEETDRQMGFEGSTYRIEDEEEEEEEEEEIENEVTTVCGGGGGGGTERNCCVCMVRHKGAAFIPCGHTFCRLCSRELWVSRGNCPLCNGFILEILDIF
ncbi:uncharacterized protein LOC103497559 isoform X1 [Cucumis melo]|uniref:Nucleolin-like n=2 Tax=Cucumis melo TaxID=3656 RepID=A0A1S3C6E1_CUCME|nr:uncharacterized protein LOC103497559 isoform X1 [Cucumis melo]